MHHSDDVPTGEARRQMNEIFSQKPPANLGATGRFPDGKLIDADQGEIAFAVGSDPKTGKVVIEFGKPVAWVGMSAQQASELAESLSSHSLRARGIDCPTEKNK